MLLIKTAFDFLNQRRDELKVARAESLENLSVYRAAGDLSENNDYIQEKQQLENIESEIQQINALLKNADILEREPGENFSTIDLGCKFKMTTTVSGNYLNFETDDSLVDDFCTYTYNKQKNQTSISGIFCFGGPTDICMERNILSSESPLGKLLIGKQLSNSGLDLELKEQGINVHVERVW